MRTLTWLIVGLLLVMSVAPVGVAHAQKPWEGKTVTVLVIAEGTHGISGPFYYYRDKWQTETGATMEVAEFPFGELHEKMFTDLLSNQGSYDIFMVGAWEYGDLVSGNHLVPVGQYMTDPKFPQWPDDQAPSVEALYKWAGTRYGVPNDSDGQVLYFRKDILTDPKWQAEFKAAVGYDLPVPPTTWDQVYDICNFFNGKDWNGTDTEPDSGITLHLRVGGQGMFHFASLSAPYVVLPGDKVDNVHNTYWFDFETMEPIINSPGHVKALEFLQKLAKTGPEAQYGWTLGEAWDYFLRGKAIMTFSWGDVGSLAQDKERSKIQGTLGCSILPGVTEVYDRSTKAFVTMEKPNVVGNTTGGSWHGVISRLSKNPDLAYHLLSYMATPDVARELAYYGWEGVDPGRKCQFMEPYGTNTKQGFLDAGWNENDIVEYNKAYYDNYYATVQLPFLRIPGAMEYWTVLDQALSEAMTGNLTAQQALDRVAEDFKGIVERLGKDDQLKVYREAMGYAGTTP